MVAHRGVVVVGSASRDVTAAVPRGWRLGGGVTYGGLALARLGLRPRVLIGVDEPVSRATELDTLRAAGAEVRVIVLPRAPVFENRETATGRVQTCLEPGDPLDPDRLPVEWRGADAWLLAPVAGELHEAWADVPPNRAMVALGWQGLLRHLPRGGLVRRRPPAASRLVHRAGIIGVSDGDLAPRARLDRLVRFLGPDATLLITAGRRGGRSIHVRSDGSIDERRYPAITAEAEVDPTGAGDVFLAAYLAAATGSSFGDPAISPLRLAAAAGSLVVEAPGIAGVPTLDAIVARLAKAPGSDEADRP